MKLRLALVCTLHCGCGAEPYRSSAEDVVKEASAVINGDDDRREVHEVSEEIQRSVSGGVAAVMWAHRIQFGEAGSVTLRARSLTQTNNVCESETFADQPAAAICSASLIDDDLVLTAGHCLGADLAEAEDHCRRLWIVFDYHFKDARGLALDSGDSVYSCRRVVWHAKDERRDDFLDLAILQLDRPAGEGRVPIALASAPPAIGDRVIAATHGAGLPLKVDEGASILEVPDGVAFFRASTDSFAGGSGGAIYNQRLELLAHQVRGEIDWEFSGDCAQARWTGDAREEHQLALTSSSHLCDAGWPSQRLCGRPPDCGDGFCSGLENALRCADDCPHARCGDGVCEVDERLDCQADCQTFPNVPASWIHDPVAYQNADQPGPASDSRTARARGEGCRMAPTPGASSSSGLLGLLLLCWRRWLAPSRQSWPG